MTVISESQWLAYYGFQQFPFERPEASNEGPEFLSTCFVEPENFSSILGKADAPTTALLFAERGTGKTACRVMVEYFCRTGNVPISSRQETAYVLSIPHTHLHLVATKANLFNARQEVQRDKLVEYHVQEILRRALPAFSDLLATTPEIYNAVASLSPASKQDLKKVILSYNTNLSSAPRDFLQNLLSDSAALSLQPKRSKKIGILRDFLRDFLDKLLFLNTTRRVQQEAPEPPQELDLKNALETSPFDHLAQLADLMHQIGIPAIYVLIDGVDEYLETAADPRKAFQLIQPLLSTLQLMDKTPHLALKFFLPDSIKSLVQTDPAIRLDRGFTFQTIHWNNKDLINILRRRLDAAKQEDNKERDRTIAGFDALCVPELRGKIEQEMAQEARGNPRHLIVLAGLMLRAHFNREVIDQEDPYQLNRQDWHMALDAYKSHIIRHNFKVEKINSDILSLIKQGENEQLEFKASLRWDFRQEKVNRKLEHVVAKTIAAFLNSIGGTLLIGVADNGQVVGLEQDIQTINHKNLDGFHQSLTQTIENYLGIVFSYLSVSFKSVENKDICVIRVKPSRKPVYVKASNESEFWVRVGNATRQLDAEKTQIYITDHWEKGHSGD